MSNSNPSLPVKKGDHVLVEIEFQKDMDLFKDGSILIHSLYNQGEKVINDEFTVVRVLPKRGEDDIRNLVIKGLENLIEQVELL